MQDCSSQLWLASMASEMYSLISNQAKTDDFTSSFNVQSGALSQVCLLSRPQYEMQWQRTGMYKSWCPQDHHLRSALWGEATTALQAP